MKLLFVLFCLCMACTSCKTRATDPTAFTHDPALLEKGKYFQREWEVPSSKTYDKIYIMPVTPLYLKELAWWGKQNMSNYDDSGVWPKMHADRNKPVAKELVKFMDKAFKDEFLNSEENHFKVVSASSVDRSTLVLELALTEMVPVKKWFIGLNLIGDGSLKGGVATMEGRIKDGATGKILMSFTDREIKSTTFAVEESGPMYWYSHAKPIIRDWAKTLVKACNEIYAMDEKEK